MSSGEDFFKRLYLSLLFPSPTDPFLCSSLHPDFPKSWLNSESFPASLLTLSHRRLSLPPSHPRCSVKVTNEWPLCLPIQWSLLSACLSVTADRSVPLDKLLSFWSRMLHFSFPSTWLAVPFESPWRLPLFFQISLITNGPSSSSLSHVKTCAYLMYTTWWGSSL